MDIGLLVSVNVEKEFVREISVQPTCGAQNEYWEKEMNRCRIVNILLLSVPSRPLRLH